MNVAVIGASNKPERYSYKALMLLQENNHTVFPIHKKLELIEGIKVFSSITDVNSAIDTITMYVGPAISSEIQDDILSCNPSRIIFNPGSENPQLEQAARDHGVEVVCACTLVMLKIGQF
ncbi:MAG: CoA-binding protein [Candidatus Zapsychrus exili]|nr:CoA-binding protein [Candidatus Zapsychrus exili]